MEDPSFGKGHSLEGGRGGTGPERPHARRGRPATRSGALEDVEKVLIRASAGLWSRFWGLFGCGSAPGSLAGGVLGGRGRRGWWVLGCRVFRWGG